MDPSIDRAFDNAFEKIDDLESYIDDRYYQLQQEFEIKHNIAQQAYNELKQEIKKMEDQLNVQ